MSIKDYEKIITIQNNITGEVKQIHCNIKGTGLFSLAVKDYLLLQEIKTLLDNNVGCTLNFGYKKF